METNEEPSQTPLLADSPPKVPAAVEEEGRPNDGVGELATASAQEGKRGAVEASPQGRYLRFEEKLGSGQYKDVYRAYDTQEGIEVAWNTVNIRMLPLEEKKRIMNEVRLLQTLNHMNLVQFHGSWLNKEQQQVIFVTEIVVNGSLKDFIAKVDLIRWKVVKRWARQILRGLSYLHGMEPPIIHRDLKCDNIFINGHTGDIRIGDLGLSTSSTRTNKTMSVLGTPEFMAPELYDESYNERVDIYAFGMCLLEMITKERPYYECQNAAQIYKKVVSRIPPAGLRRIESSAARNFISLCIDYEPSNRPSADDLLRHPFLEPNDEEDNAQVRLIDPSPPDHDTSMSPKAGFHAVLGEGMPSALDPAFLQPPVTHPAQRGTPTLSTIHESTGMMAVPLAGAAALAEEEDMDDSFVANVGGIGAASAAELGGGESTEEEGGEQQQQQQEVRDAEGNVGIASDGGVQQPLNIPSQEFKSEGGPAVDHEEILKAMPPDESNMKDLNLPEGRVERDSTDMRGVDPALLLSQQQADGGGAAGTESPHPPSSPLARGVEAGTEWRSRSLSPPADRRGSATAFPPGRQPGTQHRYSNSGVPPKDPSEAHAMTHQFLSSPGALNPPTPPPANVGVPPGKEPQLEQALQALPIEKKSGTHIKYAQSQGTEKDVMRLVMHAQVEGRLQEVEFDFNLKQDRADEVAAEMIEELQLPKHELDPIIQTIEGLAEHARSRRLKRTPSGGSIAQQVVGGTAAAAVHSSSSEVVTETRGGDAFSEGVDNVCAPAMPAGDGPVLWSEVDEKSDSLKMPAAPLEPTLVLADTPEPIPEQGAVVTSHSDDDVGAASGPGLTKGVDGNDEEEDDDDVDDLEEDEEYEKAKENFEKKMRQARKAYDARQQKLLIALNNCIEENRRQQEKFRRNYEGFEQKKRMMAVEFERRVEAISMEWKDVEDKHRQQRKAFRESIAQYSVTGQVSDTFSTKVNSVDTLLDSSSGSDGGN
jgi:WNK lysine deficient protein kinase